MVRARDCCGSAAQTPVRVRCASSVPPAVGRSSRSSFHLGSSCYDRVVVGASWRRTPSGACVHVDQRRDWLCDGGDPADCGLQIPPFDQPLHGIVGGSLGVGLAAFLVTAALAGRAGVADLGRRSVRWRVPVRWYLIALFYVPVAATLISLAIYGPRALAAPAGGWPRALAEVAAYFLLQLVLFQLAEEIGFTGFLQHHWQDRYSPMKLTLYVALLWALWHLPDHFAEEGWGVEQLIAAPVVFAIGFVSLFFARALLVWLYNRTGSSVLLVAIFHSSFDAAI